MLVLKLCQQSSQLWGCFKPILMETWGWGMGEGCIPFSDHRTEFFFSLYKKVGKQIDSSEKDATNTQSDFYIWVQNEKVLHRSVNLT